MVLDECPALPATEPLLARVRCTHGALGARGVERRFLALRSEACLTSPSPTPGKRSSASCRAASSPDLRAAKRRGRRCAIGFEGYAIGGLSVGEDRRRCIRTVEITAPLLPDETATISHGRRHAAGPRGVRGARHRHVRLRDADAKRPKRPTLHQRGVPSTSRTRGLRKTISRPIRRAGATPAGTFHAPICAISSCRRDRWEHP